MESAWSCQRTTLICVPSCLISFVVLQVMIFLGWVRLNTLAFIVIGCSGTAFVRESRDVMESVGTVTGAKAFSSLSVVCESLVSWLMTMSFVGEFHLILNLDIFTGDFCSWSLVILLLFLREKQTALFFWFFVLMWQLKYFFDPLIIIGVIFEMYPRRSSFSSISSKQPMIVEKYTHIKHTFKKLLLL